MEKSFGKFESEKREYIENIARDQRLKKLAEEFLGRSLAQKYPYVFSWLGSPIIQYPADIVAIQEIIWQVKPDLVLETGIAHGGGLILYASILELIGKGEVLGIDVEIRPHNKKAIQTHPLFKRIKMLEGSSTDPKIFERVQKIAKGKEKILVILDSNHTCAHVKKELELYAPLVKKGSYLIVCDTFIEDLPEGAIRDRPFGKGNNPKIAVEEFLGKNKHFLVDETISSKLLITAFAAGYLKRIK
ncbi:MAG: cephalosporin hydroxylase family protein [Patescibacteria group bacterium]